MERIKLAVDKARKQAASGSAGTAQVAAEPGSNADTFLQRRGPVPIRTSQPLDPQHLADHRIVAFERTNPARWVFDLLRTQVLQKMSEQGWKTLAVTSPTAGCGKTVASINLAMSIAHHPQQSATLVDLDLRRPCISNYLGLNAGASPSISDLLDGQAELHECVVDVGLPGLQVIPGHGSVEGASEVLASAHVGRVIDRLRSADPQGIVVFDLPPITAVDDVIAVLPKIDCVLLVVGNGMSNRREIQEAQRHLGRANVLGYVLNKAAVPVRNPGYY